MSGDRDTQFIETTMDDDEIDRLLRGQGHGIVSLCDGGQPYSIPVSFGYDGDHLYFPFLVTDEARKSTVIEAESLVRFLVTDVRDLFNWQSVSVTDHVEAVDPDSSEWDRFVDALVKQGWFKPEFEHAASIDSIEGWRLGMESVDGRKREAFTYE